MIGGTVWSPSVTQGEQIVSFSQNAEDVRLWRAFRTVADGFYVDIGAGDPHEYSVTKLFYDRGWSGINVEPGPSFTKLEADRPRDVNLNLAVGPTEAVREFWVSAPHSGLSTFYPPSTEDPIPDGFRFERRSVECKPVWRILADHAPGRRIDFMTVDVEGAEGEVIRSIDFESSRPTVLAVEALTPLTLAPSHEDWEPFVLEAGYQFAAFDGINRFYVDRSHEELIPVLAYPISVVDRFETASAREARAAAEERIRRVEGERATVAEQLDRTRVELAQTQDQLAAVYQSRTWRAGRTIAAAGHPLQAVARRVRQGPLGLGRTLAPAAAYASFVAKGQPWHFPQARVAGRMRRGGGPLDGLITRLGEPDIALDEARGSEIAEELELLNWTHEDSLIARRLSWDERQAVVEVDALVQLVAMSSRETEVEEPGRTATAGPVVVVDARCLQEPVYGTRGVGQHSRRVLEATRAATRGHALVLLTSAELADLPPDVAEVADRIVFTPYPTRSDDVALFVQLSPMTASCAAAVPFLCRRACATASVVYDFIPTEFPDAYLQSAASILANRARIEALRHYDHLLPISASTEAACQLILGEGVATSVTGVGDPLDDADSQPDSWGQPFMLVPTGGDPRKNTAAAVAALAHYWRTGDAPMRVAITGALTPAQEAALKALARRLGLPDGAVEVRGYVRKEELASLYEAAELVMVPSVTEGFSIPVAEAVLRGTPVVASDIDPHRELVGSGPWLAPGADVEALARSISAVRNDRDGVIRRQRHALGDAADPASVSSRVRSAIQNLVPERSQDRQTRALGRERPRLAVVAPFPPQRSGVADYTAFSFRQVAKYADVDVYSPARADSSDSWRMHPLSAAPYLDRRFDAVVNVLGNSHFHFPVLDLMSSYGGAGIAHDNRLLEAYRLDRGNAWTAKFISRGTEAVHAEQIDDFLLDLDRLPSIAYDIVARQASPLIVHGSALAQRIFRETGVRPAVIPFVPYNVPSLDTLDSAARRSARRVLGLADDIIHLATFGIVDRRTKGTDLIVAALSWLRKWGLPAHLHIVGDVSREERRALEDLSNELAVRRHLTLHGHVANAALEDFLIAVDVAIQLRMSAVLSLSGALADCIAFGVPTVTTQALFEELDAPSYVVAAEPALSSLLIAEAVDGLSSRRRDYLSAIENERREYLARRSVDGYARALLDALGLRSG